MPWSLSPSHHGIELILDESGSEVGHVERDRLGYGWIASACPKRFPTRASLPAVFGGRFEIVFASRGDLLRFFGLPFPGEGCIQSDVLTRGYGVGEAA